MENQRELGLSVLLRVSECAHTLIQHHYTRRSDLIAQPSHASKYSPAERKEYLRCVSTTGLFELLQTAYEMNFEKCDFINFDLCKKKKILSLMS